MSDTMNELRFDKAHESDYLLWYSSCRSFLCISNRNTYSHLNSSSNRNITLATWVQIFFILANDKHKTLQLNYYYYFFSINFNVTDLQRKSAQFFSVYTEIMHKAIASEK